jgi:serine/threonine protein phosphatase PrpC
LKKLFRYLNDSTLEISKKTGEHYKSGTTLSAVYIPENEARFYAGVIGDSPIILARKNGEIEMSPEHNVRSNIEERNLAIKRGGIFNNGYICDKDGNGLQMSRDIGYHKLGDILDRNPDVYDREIFDGDAIIVCSDGLLDPGHSYTHQEAKRVAKLVLDGADAEILVANALKRVTGDNVTAIVYKR